MEQSSQQHPQDPAQTLPHRNRPAPSHMELIESSSLRFAAAMKKDFQEYLDTSALAKFALKVIDFSLASEGTKYFRPLSTQDAKKWLGESKPWNTSAGTGAGPSSLDVGNYLPARDLAFGLRAWAKQAEVPANSVPPTETSSFMDYTEWQTRIYRPFPSGCHDGAYFDVDRMFDPDDEDKPHMLAFLISSSLPRENCLTASEVLCIYHLIYDRVQHKIFKDHTTPLNMVSVSGRQVRILTVHVDIDTSEIVVEKSSILSFAFDDYRMSADWIKLMCWAYANPIGQTKLS